MKYIFFSVCVLLTLHGYAQQNPKDTATLVYVEEMPGAPYSLNEYLAKNLKYPKSAKKAGIEGRIIVRFVIDEKGEVTDCAIVKGIGKACDEEALRVVRNMPPWKPGRQDGKAVKVYYNLPIVFTLEDDAPARKGAPKWKKKKE